MLKKSNKMIYFFISSILCLILMSSSVYATDELYNGNIDLFTKDEKWKFGETLDDLPTGDFDEIFQVIHGETNQANAELYVQIKESKDEQKDEFFEDDEDFLEARKKSAEAFIKKYYEKETSMKFQSMTDLEIEESKFDFSGVLSTTVTVTEDGKTTSQRVLYTSCESMWYEAETSNSDDDAWVDNQAYGEMICIVTSKDETTTKKFDKDYESLRDSINNTGFYFCFKMMITGEGRESIDDYDDEDIIGFETSYDWVKIIIGIVIVIVVAIVAASKKNKMDGKGENTANDVKVTMTKTPSGTERLQTEANRVNNNKKSEKYKSNLQKHATTQTRYSRNAGADEKYLDNLRTLRKSGLITNKEYNDMYQKHLKNIKNKH